MQHCRSDLHSGFCSPVSTSAFRSEGTLESYATFFLPKTSLSLSLAADLHSAFCILHSAALWDLAVSGDRAALHMATPRGRSAFCILHSAFCSPGEQTMGSRGRRLDDLRVDDLS